MLFKTLLKKEGTCYIDIITVLLAMFIIRFYFDLSIFSNGLGSVSVFIFLEFYLFTSALVVYPCLKVSSWYCNKFLCHA